MAHIRRNDKKGTDDEGIISLGTTEFVFHGENKTPESQTLQKPFEQPDSIDLSPSDPPEKFPLKEEYKKKEIKHGHGTAIWDSGLEIIESPTIYIDAQVIALCNAIQKKFSGMEFSVLLKGDWNDDGFHVSFEEYIIPKQTVTEGTVKYDEDISAYRKDGYNAMLHCHPFPSDSFSGTDDDSINSHFPCSLLYSCGDITTATLLIIIKDGIKLRLNDVNMEMIDNRVVEVR